MLGAVAASIQPLPIITLKATTNFSESRATINATVDGVGLSTTVTVQVSLNNGDTWSNPAVEMVGTASSSPFYGLADLYANVSGLVAAENYIVLVTATNVKREAFKISGGADTGNFTTWGVKTFTQTTSGSFTVSVPSVTPTNSTAIAPSIWDIAIFGGGGGANYSGGGGGGYRKVTSKQSSLGGTQDVTGSVGAGGTGGNGGTGNGGATAGGSTTLTIGNTTYTATGGGAGSHVGNCGAPNGTGGSSGSGDNNAQSGGANTYGYYYVSGYQYVCTQYDKYGINCTAGYYDYNQPIYSWDCGYYAGGGGGGAGGAGAAAATQSSNSHVGGAGGAGYDSTYGLRGGAGGGGNGTQGLGANGTTSGTGGTIVGTGGQGWYGAGVAGGVTFKYYGP